jgi:hypothetical protein
MHRETPQLLLLRSPFFVYRRLFHKWQIEVITIVIWEGEREVESSFRDNADTAVIKHACSSSSFSNSAASYKRESNNILGIFHPKII